MKSISIQPFYFPTTVAFIDDSAPFLANLCLQLSPQLAFKLFHSPALALAALNQNFGALPIASSFFSIYRHRENASYTDHVIQVSLDKIHREVHDANRFQQVSVIVVDYDMPEMNGLEFCRQLKTTTIKKFC